MYSLIAIIAISIIIALWKDLRYAYYVAYAEKIIKTNSYTFYKAFSKISTKQKREAVYIVYAFCRYADDIIDEHKDEVALKQLQTNLEQFKAGKRVNHPIFKALYYVKKAFYHHDYDFKPYFDMIEGQYMDTHKTRYESIEDLLVYCYYVASSVGLMLIPILAGETSKKLEDFAVHLGYAMQLTNILRDVGEDYKKNRIYIPKNVLETFDIDLEYELKEGPTDHFKKMFTHVERIARNYYDKALKDIELFPKDVRKPLYYAAILYRAILDKSKEVGYDTLHQKPFLTDQEKMDVIKNEAKSYAS
jgi:phytoene synthase